MSWAGCYSLDLYCENYMQSPKNQRPDDGADGVHAFDEFPHQYTAELGSVCRANARKDGWIIRMDGTCICPKCSGKREKAKEKTK